VSSLSNNLLPLPPMEGPAMSAMRIGVTLALLGLFAAPASAQTSDVCLRRSATIVGTQQNDLRFGTSGVDIAVGLKGDDLIFGWPQHERFPDTGDFICGGRGDDTLRPGYGEDAVRGNAGEDDLYGKNGADRLRGGSGADRLFGGRGHDRLRGG
ncbi:MAG: hypothetical protein M3Q20_00875, partial [Actinomycetota bacterium]|nr:hypothetical protein [Actinomycetota bacterium]